MAGQAPLRWGLLGTARINRAVIPPIRSSNNSQLLAVASRAQEKAAKYAAQWNIPRAFSSYEALLSDPEIDVVYISLPNSLHAEWSIRAMRMGKHVLCEKPITTSTKELDDVMNVSWETGMIITEAYMYRHHPQTLLVKQMVEGGELGALQLIHGSFCYYNTREADPRFDPDLGGGSLWDIGCYPVGYSIYLTGKEPIEVFGQQVTSPTGIDLLFAGQMRFAGGFIVQFDCSFISEYQVEMVVTAEKGRLIIPEPYKPGKRTRIVAHRSGQEQVIKIKGQELYQGEIEDLENAILFGKSPLINLTQSRSIIRTLEALYLSAQKSQPVILND